MTAARVPLDPQADRRYMAEAIAISLEHRGLTAENPSVGAVIVATGADGDVIVGRGITAIGGRPHAELQALAEAGARAKGATAYVTLEPCSHVGRTPPCADALVSAGIARVVVATLDPDIRVAGRGVSILERAGIAVTLGCLQAEARRAMAGFLSLKGRGRPYVTLKLAVSTDGMIGRKGSGQVSITGPEARHAVQLMRIEHEAVLVGVGTVIEDDPLLTVRLPGREHRTPTRVVIDPFGRTPAGAMLLDAAAQHRVVILVSEKAPPRQIAALRERGAIVRPITSDFRGRFDAHEILRVLGILGLKSVLVEGGAETARRFLEAAVVDRIALFTSDVVVGQDGIASPLTEANIPEGFDLLETRQFGADRMFDYERLA